MIRKGLSTLLNSRVNGYKYVVDEAETADEALKIISKINYDIVIMEYQLKGMTGSQLTKRMLSLNPYLKIVCVSEYDNHSYVKEMTDAGAFGYLQKSASRNEFITLIETILKLEKEYIHAIVPKQQTFSIDKVEARLRQENIINPPTPLAKLTKFKKSTLTKREQ